MSLGGLVVTTTATGGRDVDEVQQTPHDSCSLSSSISSSTTVRSQQRGDDGQSCDKSAESTHSLIEVSDQDEFTIVGEIASAYNLMSEDPSDDGSANAELKPYALVRFGREMIHRTEPATESGRHPTWTISTRSLFVLTATARELIRQRLEISVWYKRRDPLRLATLERCFLGKAVLKTSEILINHCNEERFEVDLTDGDVDTGLDVRGQISLRFRLAAPSDEAFLELYRSRPDLFKQSGNPLVYETLVTPAMELQREEKRRREAEEICMLSASRSLRPKEIKVAKQEPDADNKPVLLAPLVSEVDETKLAGRSFVAAVSTAFRSRSYYDSEAHMRKVLVKPHPDPDRVDETSYLAPHEIRAETLKPSKEWVQAGSGGMAFGNLYVEILSCKDLPNVDVGEAVGNVTDAFIAVVFEDSMVQTPVIYDELSPHWLPWTQRAFMFGITHPASMLYIGAFDFDLGMTPHDPLGRVAVNISNLQRDTTYTLKYNLYNSSIVTDRIEAGSITIRLRIEYKNEREAVMAALLRPRPKFYVNVRKEKSLSVVRYTCFGQYGADNEQQFDLTLTRSYVNEIFDYKSSVGYCFGDAIRSLLFWHGQVRVANVMLPIHSFLFFCMAVTVVERPYLTPPFTLLSIAWVMLALLNQRRQHPSPWNQCPSFWSYLQVLRTGKSSVAVRRINVNQRGKEVEAYEKAWQDRKDKDARIAAKKAALQAEINTIEDDAIHTKQVGMIPLDLLVRLANWQRYLSNFCRNCRYLKIILTWEESIISFKITAFFLAAGLVSLLLPWCFILRWTSRIIAWGVFGPHMKLVDVIWLADSRQSMQDSNIEIREALKDFAKKSRTARLKQQEAVKLKDMKTLTFGAYSTLVPSYNLSRHYDRPLPGSFASTLRRSIPQVTLAPHHVPGQQLTSDMIPRTQPAAQLFEKERSELVRLLDSLQHHVKEYQESPFRVASSVLDMRSHCTDDNTLPESIGFELISYRDGAAGTESVRVEAPGGALVVANSQRRLSFGNRNSSNTRMRRNTSGNEQSEDEASHDPPVSSVPVPVSSLPTTEDNDTVDTTVSSGADTREEHEEKKEEIECSYPQYTSPDQTALALKKTHPVDVQVETTASSGADANEEHEEKKEEIECSYSQYTIPDQTAFASKETQPPEVQVVISDVSASDSKHADSRTKAQPDEVVSDEKLECATTEHQEASAAARVESAPTAASSETTELPKETKADAIPSLVEANWQGDKGLESAEPEHEEASASAREESAPAAASSEKAGSPNPADTEEVAVPSKDKDEETLQGDAPAAAPPDAEASLKVKDLVALFDQKEPQKAAKVEQGDAANVASLNVIGERPLDVVGDEDGEWCDVTKNESATSTNSDDSFGSFLHCESVEVVLWKQEGSQTGDDVDSHATDDFMTSCTSTCSMGPVVRHQLRLALRPSSTSESLNASSEMHEIDLD